MIIRRPGSSQLLITQPDHAGQAGDIMERWHADGFPDSPRRSSILLAIKEHDNGWCEVDAAPIVDGTGRILDFMAAPDTIRRDIWPRGVERLAATPYAAALVAQHALHVYGRYRTDPAWRSFFTDMEAARSRHLRAATPSTLSDLLRDYLYLRVGDLVSLTFCTGWTDVQTDDGGYTVQFDGGRVIITPDPFAGAEVPLEIAARELPDRSFRSTSDAQSAFSRAPRVAVTGVASGP